MLEVGDIVATVLYTDDTKQVVKQILNYGWIYKVNTENKDYAVLSYVPHPDPECVELSHSLKDFERVILIESEVMNLDDAIKKMANLTERMALL